MAQFIPPNFPQVPTKTEAFLAPISQTIGNLPSLLMEWQKFKQEKEKQRAQYGRLGELGNLPGLTPTAPEFDAMNPAEKLSAFGTEGTRAIREGSMPSVRGSLQQTSFVDSSDSMPLFFDRDGRSYVRSDGQPIRGMAIPLKGNQEATQTASRGAELLPKIDELFDRLSGKSEFGARVSSMPIFGGIVDPVTNQLKSEIMQVGFTFGGKNFTGTEKDIIVDALVPTVFDNDQSRENKRTALKGYVTGQIDLLQAANLLGPAGTKVRQVIQSGQKPASPRPKNPPKETPEQRKARLLAELAGAK